MNPRKAVLAGLTGAAGMSLLMLLLRWMGITRMNLELMLGSMITRSFSTGSWLLGLVLYLCLGAITGILYGHILERIHRSGWQIGLVLGGVHAVASGFLLPFLGQVHPLVWDRVLTSPGVFASGMGWPGTMLFAGLHLIYGALVASVYSIPVPEVSPIPPAIRRRPEEVQAGSSR